MKRVRTTEGDPANQVLVDKDWPGRVAAKPSGMRILKNAAPLQHSGPNLPQVSRIREMAVTGASPAPLGPTAFCPEWRARRLRQRNPKDRGRTELLDSNLCWLKIENKGEEIISVQPALRQESFCRQVFQKQNDCLGLTGTATTGVSSKRGPGSGMSRCW